MTINLLIYTSYRPGSQQMILFYRWRLLFLHGNSVVSDGVPLISLDSHVITHRNGPSLNPGPNAPPPPPISPPPLCLACITPSFTEYHWHHNGFSLQDVLITAKIAGPISSKLGILIRTDGEAIRFLLIWSFSVVNTFRIILYRMLPPSRPFLPSLSLSLSPRS